jgi:hypothetical protein
MIVTASLSMYLAVQGGWDCCNILAANSWEQVRLILLLLSLVTGWSLVVQGVLMSINDSWHANPAAPIISSCATEHSAAQPPHYRTFKDDERIRTSMPKVEVYCYLLILTGTDHYR